jgi:hypothetical protein
LPIEPRNLAGKEALKADVHIHLKSSRSEKPPVTFKEVIQKPPPSIPRVLVGTPNRKCKESIY